MKVVNVSEIPKTAPKDIEIIPRKLYVFIEDKNSRMQPTYYLRLCVSDPGGKRNLVHMSGQCAYAADSNNRAPANKYEEFHGQVTMESLRD